MTRAAVFGSMAALLTAGCVARSSLLPDGDTDGVDTSPVDPTVTTTVGTTSDDTGADGTGGGQHCAPPDAACDADCPDWTWTIDGPIAGDDSITDLALAPDGTIVALGIVDRLQDQPTSDVWVGRLTPGGELVQETRIDVSGIDDYGYDLALDGSGDAYAIGTAGPGGSSFLVRVFADGDWKELPVGSAAESLGTTADDELVIGGRETVDGVERGWLERRSLDGDLLLRLDAQLPAAPNAIFAISPFPGGDLALAGFSVETGGGTAWLARLGPAGKVRWVVRPDRDPDHDQWIDDVAVLPSGDLVTVGVAHGVDYNGLAWFARFEGQTGEMLAEGVDEGIGCCANGFDRVAVSADGRAFATGVQGASDDGGLVGRIAELDCDGIAWQVEHHSPGWDSVFMGGVAVTAAGELVVSGTEHPGPFPDDGGPAVFDHRGFIRTLRPSP